MADHNMEIFYNFVELFASCHQASFHWYSMLSSYVYFKPFNFYDVYVSKYMVDHHMEIF